MGNSAQALLNLRAAGRKSGNKDPLHAVVAGDSTGNYLDPVLRPGKVYVSGDRLTGWVNGPRTGLAVTPGLHVLLEYDEYGRYFISRVDGDAELNSGSDPNVTSQPPRQTITQDMLETLRLSATGEDLIVTVKSWVAIVDRVAYQFSGNSIDLTSLVPGADEMCYVVIFVSDDFSTLEAYASTPRGLSDIQLNITDIQECIDQSSTFSTPVWAIPLADGQTTLDMADIQLGVDLRNLVNNTLTGGLSGDVSGPSTSTDRAIPTWDGTDGRTLRDNPFATIDSSGNITSISYRISGVGGNGFTQYTSQSSDPSAPADGFRLYSDASDRLSWIKQGDSFPFTLAGTPSATRIQTLQDADGTIALTNTTGQGYVMTTPPSSATNVIQPSGDFITQINRGHGTQSVNLHQWQNSASGVLGYVGFAGAFGMLGSNTIASAAGATWGGIAFGAGVATLTGSTNVSTAAGFNYLSIARPTITSVSAITVTNAATVYIANSPTVGGSTTITNAYSLWVDAGITRLDGLTGIGGVNPLVPLHVLGSLGEIRTQDVLTDATAKQGRFTVAHYTNSEEPVSMFIVSNLLAANVLSIGGGSALANAVTGQIFYTAANTTTVSGTEVMRFTSAQNVGINTPSGSVGAKLQVNGAASGVTAIFRADATTPGDILQLQTNTPTTIFSVGATGVVAMQGSNTIASGASAVWNGISYTAATATITGSTNITTAAGFNYLNIARPTLSAASALTVSNSATVYIANSPLGAGAGPATITNAYSLWVDAGNVRFDDDLGVGISPLYRLDILEATLGDIVMRMSSVATNDDPTELVYQNRATTTDATVTTLHTFTVPASTTYYIHVIVTARRTGGTAGTAEDGATYEFAGTYKNVAGVATIIGAVTVIHTAEDQAGWDATFDVTGATVRVRITGAVDNNITWHMSAARVYPVST